MLWDWKLIMGVEEKKENVGHLDPLYKCEPAHELSLLNMLKCNCWLTKLCDAAGGLCCIKGLPTEPSSEGWLYLLLCYLQHLCVKLNVVTRAMFALICQAFMMQMCKHDLIETAEYIMANQHSGAVSNQQACVAPHNGNNDCTLCKIITTALKKAMKAQTWSCHVGLSTISGKKNPLHLTFKAWQIKGMRIKARWMLCFW